MIEQVERVVGKTEELLKKLDEEDKKKSKIQKAYPKSWQIMSEIYNSEDEKTDKISKEEVDELIMKVLLDPNSEFRQQLMKDLEELQKKKEAKK